MLHQDEIDDSAFNSLEYRKETLRPQLVFLALQMQAPKFVKLIFEGLAENASPACTVEARNNKDTKIKTVEDAKNKIFFCSPNKTLSSNAFQILVARVQKILNVQ